MAELRRVKSIIEEYLAMVDNVFDNANRYFSPTGLFNYVTENVLKQATMNMLPPKVYKAHVEGYIYVHKLPYSLFIPYCCGHSVKRFLEKGLYTPTIYSKPARHFNTYVDHIVNYLSSMQQYFTGAQSLNAVEYYAGPFIERDNLGFNGVKQEIQRMLFNLNFPTRIGMQTPFTNFTIVLDAPNRMIKEDRVVYNGVEDGVLADYVDEAIVFVKALAANLYEGDGRGSLFTFPIPTIMATSKVIYEDPELFHYIFETTALRGSFYWLNTRMVDPDSSFAMCCRINIDRKYLAELASLSQKYVLKKELEELHEHMLRRIESIRSGGIWAIPDITGSIGVITINLPRIAFESRGEDQVFYEKLDNVLDIVREGLIWMRKQYHTLASKYPQLYTMPLTYIPEVFRLENSPFFSTIGIIGLPEAAAICLQEPKLWIEPLTERLNEATNVMEKIIDYIVSKAREWSIESGIPYNVEEVPGETAAFKLALKDLHKYRDLEEYVEHGGAIFYSNSVVPYYTDLGLSMRIEIESRIQKKFTGGVMMHIFLGEEVDPEALAKLTKRLTYGTDLVYWSYTPAITICRKCGWIGVGVYSECPKCGSREVEVWSRIIGYYRPIKNWHPMRRKEFMTRIHYRSIPLH